MKLLHVGLMSVAAALLLAACDNLPTRATDEGSVVKTVRKADNSVETISNKSDYANYVDGVLKANEAKVVRLTCPPQGCTIGSLEVPINGGGGEVKLGAPPGPPDTIGVTVVKGFFGTIDKTLGKVGDAIPFVAGAKVLGKAFDAAAGKSNTTIDNSNRSTDSSNRSVVNDSSNRSTNTDNSNRSVNASNNRNCQTGAPNGTTGQSGSSGPASC